ncbi:MAG: hemolysin III family protein [Acutalibacteraceae bacterium]
MKREMKALIKEVKLVEYSKTVDLLNCLTHAVGSVLSVIFTVMMLEKAVGARHIFSAIIYGISFFAVFTVSAVYHGLRDEKKKRKARLVDHSTVPLLIAGTATPCAMITLHEVSPGRCVLVMTLGWFCFLFGLFSKLFFFEKLNAVTMAVYIVSGAVMLLSVVPIIDKIDSAAFMKLVCGCVLYLIGAIFCALGKKKPFCHIIFHVFVLLGAVVHFYVIYKFVI